MPEAFRPKILVLTWLYDNQPGFEVYRQRIRSLLKLGDVVLVLRHSRFESEFRELGVRIEVIHTEDTLVPRLVYFAIRCGLRARKGPWSLVMLLGAQTAPILWLLSARCPTALYWNEHPSHFLAFGRRNPLKRWFRHRLIDLVHVAVRRVTRVMPIGPALAEDLVRHGVSFDRIRLVPMGVSPRFAELPRAQADGAAAACGPLRLFYAGTISAERGRDVMLEGLALARQAGIDAVLTLVGVVPEAEEILRGQLRHLNLEASVHLVGRVPGAAVPALMAQADLGICVWAPMPWWEFNPPTKLFEYQAAGLPVLASRIRTHTDYVRDGDNGWIFDYEPASFAAAIRKAAEGRDRLPAMGAAARRDGRTQLWPAVEPLFVRTVEEAMGAPRP